jgi:hypothetical protein
MMSLWKTLSANIQTSIERLKRLGVSISDILVLILKYIMTLARSPRQIAIQHKRIDQSWVCPPSNYGIIRTTIQDTTIQLSQAKRLTLI